MLDSLDGADGHRPAALPGMECTPVGHRLQCPIARPDAGPTAWAGRAAGTSGRRAGAGPGRAGEVEFSRDRSCAGAPLRGPARPTPRPDPIDDPIFAHSIPVQVLLAFVLDRASRPWVGGQLVDAPADPPSNLPRQLLQLSPGLRGDEDAVFARSGPCHDMQPVLLGLPPWSIGASRRLSGYCTKSTTSMANRTDIDRDSIKSCSSRIPPLFPGSSLIIDASIAYHAA